MDWGMKSNTSPPQCELPELMSTLSLHKSIFYESQSTVSLARGMFCQRILCSLNVKAQGVWGWGQGEGWGFQLPIIMISVILEKLNKKNPLLVSFNFLQHVDLCECHPFIFLTSSTKVWEPCNCLFESSELSSGIPAGVVQQEGGRQAKWRWLSGHQGVFTEKRWVRVSYQCAQWRWAGTIPGRDIICLLMVMSASGFIHLSWKTGAACSEELCLWEAPVESSHPEDGLRARDPEVIRMSSHLQILWQGFYKQLQGSLLRWFL